MRITFPTPKLAHFKIRIKLLKNGPKIEQQLRSKQHLFRNYTQNWLCSNLFSPLSADNRIAKMQFFLANFASPLLIFLFVLKGKMQNSLFLFEQPAMTIKMKGTTQNRWMKNTKWMDHFRTTTNFLLFAFPSSSSFQFVLIAL